MLQRTVSITNDAEQMSAIFGGDYDIDGFRFAYLAENVNPVSVSVH